MLPHLQHGWAFGSPEGYALPMAYPANKVVKFLDKSVFTSYHTRHVGDTFLNRIGHSPIKRGGYNTGYSAFLSL